jgi:hypothetical protein
MLLLGWMQNCPTTMLERRDDSFAEEAGCEHGEVSFQMVLRLNWHLRPSGKGKMGPTDFGTLLGNPPKQGVIGRVHATCQTLHLGWSQIAPNEGEVCFSTERQLFRTFTG